MGGIVRPFSCDLLCFRPLKTTACPESKRPAIVRCNKWTRRIIIAVFSRGFDMGTDTSKVRRFAGLAASLFLLAAGSALATTAASVAPMGAEEAIRLAEASAPAPVSGRFLLPVQASGKDQGILFLNSHPDYRSPKNISIELLPDVAKQLGKRLGGKPGEVLRGKTVLVTGEVRRVPIYLVSRANDRLIRNRLPPQPAYYQTHIFLRNADDLQVVEPEGPAAN